MVSLTRPTPARSHDPLTALWQRSQVAGALPLLTWYHGADRGELSAQTLLTWVTKSVHLLDSEGVEPGGVARLSICATRPGHWTSCVWLLASWWAGLRADVTGHAEPAVEVIGPDADTVSSADVLIQCSLTPLATACETLLPGAIDNADVLAGPDDLLAARPAMADEVWLSGRHDWTGEHLFGVAPLNQPVVLSPDRIRLGGGELVATTLVGCLLGGGSLVLVESADDVAAIATQEGATEV
ncbi:TIGR03089 family protein [Cutibacterium sp. WCA-380-WT-3A]|uniref:TIGR03089 family protein n=1 Tax=Cutibacterium porci TaxID=2605781 RepID=A0A7K0J7Q1_9ACTN|nr:TIGR03089 family protein [Cutibacterium porci]MSS45959.1 TIGR03089 family protein [Cutibacterium porci]